MSDFDEILNSIRKIADDHEEPYKEGSWENFVKTKRKIIPVWPMLVSGLAASVIIGFFILSPMLDSGNSSSHSPKPVVSGIKPGVAPTTTERKDKIKNTVTGPIRNMNNRDKVGSHGLLTQDERNSDQKAIKKPENETLEGLNHVPLEPAFEEDIPLPLSLADHTVKESIQNSLEGFKPETPKANKTRRLNFGFSASPLLASSKNSSNLGVSTGVQADIRMSRKISINSGLTLTYQEVENSYGNQASPKDPVSLNSKLISFDVPVNFKFTLKKEKNKESYLLAGVSSVGFLRERNTYTYQYEEVISSFDLDFSGGQPLPTYETIAKEANLENIEPAFGTFHFIGFMNLSVGHKSSLSKNVYLTIAPYVKLPLTGLGSENLLYTNGGISLIISK